MTLSRREFFGLAGAAAVVAPTLPALAYQASAPGDRDATRWLQRKINALGPGDTLRVPSRWYQVDGTLEVTGHGVTISGCNLYTAHPHAPAIRFEGSHGCALTDCRFDGFGYSAIEA